MFSKEKPSLPPHNPDHYHEVIIRCVSSCNLKIHLDGTNGTFPVVQIISDGALVDATNTCIEHWGVGPNTNSTLVPCILVVKTVIGGHTEDGNGRLRFTLVHSWWILLHHCKAI